MGIIQRQTVKNSIVQYVGIGIGAVSMMLIYPRALEIYGLVQALISAAGITFPIVLLGTTLLSVRYFPVFENRTNQHNGFLGFLLLILLAGTLLFTAIFPFIESWLVKLTLAAGKPEWYQQFTPAILPLTLLLVFARFFAQYTSNFHRIVVPSILEDLGIKITLPLLILFYYYKWLNAEQVVNGVLFTYLLATVGLIAYLGFLGQLYWKPQFRKVDKKLAKEMSEYAGYGILSSFSSKAAFNLDAFMVSAMIDLPSTGVYSISAFLADTLGKPVKSLTSISQPIISKAIDHGNLAEVEMIYKKSALNLLIFGYYLFLGIWVCLDDIFRIMPNTLVVSSGKYVVLYLCLAKLTDMATSVNTEIIQYSRHFRFNLFAVVLMSVLNIAFNLVLIPRFQIVGAAVATFITLTIYNLVKLFFIQAKFKIHPFSIQMLWLTGIAILVYFATLLLPGIQHPILSIFINGSIITVLFSLLVFRWKISQEFNALITNAFRLAKKWLGAKTQN